MIRTSKREGEAMRSDRRTVLIGAAIVRLALLGIWSSASPCQASAAYAMVRGYEIAFDQSPATDGGEDKTPQRKKLLIIGASSLIGPLGQPQLVGALLESKGTSMYVEGKFFGTEALDQMLSSRKVWDYVIMDAWQFR